MYAFSYKNIISIKIYFNVTEGVMSEWEQFNKSSQHEKLYFIIHKNQSSPVPFFNNCLVRIENKN